MKSHFKDLADAEVYCQQHSLSIKFSQDLHRLLSPAQVGKFPLSNRIVFQPMEGCDGTGEGSPTDNTLRRYRRFGGSGAGIVWFEATAVAPEGRANPRQLMITEENKLQIKSLLAEFEQAEANILGSDIHPHPTRKILQLTHSGRYSKPDRKTPYRMYSYPLLDAAYGLSKEDGLIVTDDYLEALIEDYLTAATLAKEIGFDGVDIKACHRYLLNESFSAFTRQNSRFGGETYEKRTKLFRTIMEICQSRLGAPNFLITTRLNVYDALPYPYGWGVQKHPKPTAPAAQSQADSVFSHPATPDLQEPARLISDLAQMGVKLANLSMGNPYFNPYVSRPYSTGVKGAPPAPEPPAVGIDRFLTLTRKLRRLAPKEISLIGAGYSWLRELGPHAAAAEIAGHGVDFCGWGRMTFAYPDFPIDLLQKGKLEEHKVCLTCSKCTELMRAGQITGCVVRDREAYAPIYRHITAH